MKKIPIIIDVDTGIDDAVALMFAAANERFEIIGITTSFGNATLNKTTFNTLQILELLGRQDIPVACGADRGLQMEEYVRKYQSVHGESGLGNIELPDPVIKPIEENAVEFMERVLRESREKVTLVPVGPMTNLAILLMTHPECKEKIDKICLMGGAALGGNAMPTAEANIFRDPEAAHILFRSGVPIVMCGLDATMKAYVTDEEIEKIKSMNQNVARTLGEMLTFYSGHYRTRAPGCAIHDVVPLLYLLNPDMLETKKHYVTVDIDGEYTRGCTVTDFFGITGHAANAEVAFDIKREQFIEQLFCAFHFYD